MLNFLPVDVPPPKDPKPGPLRLPKPEDFPGLIPLKPPGIGHPLPPGGKVPGFLISLPKPRWWRRPGVWIAPLALVLALMAWVVSQLPRAEVFPPSDERLPTVVIDAGHGGHDTGATGNGLVEKDLALDTALRLQTQLRRRGYAVVMTRDDDRFLPLYERSQFANALPKALFISIHYNDNATTSGDGVETFFAVQKAGILSAAFGQTTAPCGEFANCVQGSLVTSLGATDRGAKPRQLAVVRYARCPAILVEGGFINNPTEARKLALPEYRDLIATAIADGVAAFQRQREQADHDARMAHR